MHRKEKGDISEICCIDFDFNRVQQCYRSAMIDKRTAFKDMLPTFPTMHLTTERHHWRICIRLDTTSTGATKSFILFTFFSHVK